MNTKTSTRLIVFALLSLFIITGFQSERLLSQELRIKAQESRIKAIEKVLNGPKYLCGIRKKIKGAWIDCDQLKNEGSE